VEEAAREVSSTPDLPPKVPRVGRAGGTLRRVLEALAEDLRRRRELDLSECFIDGAFVVAKKGGSEWERPSGAKALFS